MDLSAEFDAMDHNSIIIIIIREFIVCLLQKIEHRYTSSQSVILCKMIIELEG